jgi:hypothetical protein
MTNLDLNQILTYDNSATSISNAYVNGTYNISSTVEDLKSTVAELTKKPEVRLDQRSSLEVVKNRVTAKYYKDGFFTYGKDLIPAIKSIEVFNENTIKMTFMNGDVQTATVQNGDPYFFEDGLLRCIVKEMIGKEGTAVLSKLLSYATKVYKDAEADKKKKAEEEAAKKAASEKNYEKAKKHWAKKRAKERENRIQEMAEAILKAKEMEKNDYQR